MTFNEFGSGGLRRAESLTVFTGTQLVLIHPEYPFLVQESAQGSGFIDLSPLPRCRTLIYRGKGLGWSF